MPLACWSSAREGTPQGLPVPGSLRFLSALKVSKVDPRQHALALALCSVHTRSCPAHAREVQTSRCPGRGNGGPSRQERLAPTGCPVRFSGVLRIPNLLELLAEHCCRRAAPRTNMQGSRGLRSRTARSPPACALRRPEGSREAVAVRDLLPPEFPKSQL